MGNERGVQQVGIQEMLAYLFAEEADRGGGRGGGTKGGGFRGARGGGLL